MQGLEGFRAEVEAAGLRPAEIISDGQLHRCPTVDKPGANDGAYLLFTDDPPAGYFLNWRTGQEGRWCAAGDGQPPTESQRQAWEAARREREAAQAIAWAEAARRAQRLLAEARACTGHSYLEAKGCKPCQGLKLDQEGRLLVPVLGADGKPQSLQTITPDGEKRFLPGGRMAGGYFAVKGADGPLLVCEGLATGLSLHESTGHTVLVAFTAGNLEAVAVMVRERYPDREIILAGDDDHATDGNPGRTRATAAALAVGAKLALPIFAQPGAGTDFNDLHQAEGLEAVKAQVEAAQAPEPDHEPPVPERDNPAPSLEAVALGDFLARTFPPRGHILTPIIPEQGLVMMFAPRGLGKTFLALSIAHAVAAGGATLRWRAPQSRRVLYLDGEMPASVMQERLARIVAGAEGEAPDDYFRLLTPDLVPDGLMPNLATPEGQAILDPLLVGVDLVVVDNLACLARAGRENEAEGWLPMQGWLLTQRRAGRSVLLVHHAGKGGEQRGTSAREDVLDTVIKLGRPQGYEPSEGARFIVELTKARGITGPEADAFEATLEKLASGGLMWATKDVTDLRLEQVRELKDLGLSVRDIAEETGIPKSTVARLVKKLEAPR